MTSLRSLRLARLAVALLLVSLASGALSPAFGLGQVSVQVYAAADWSSWAATAWAYYAPGVGVSSVTGLHRANLGWACFTDWDLGSYIYSIIFARKLGLISDSGPWQFDDRIVKILTFLENRPLNSDPSSGYPIPFWGYQYDAMNPFKSCVGASRVFTDAADSGRLLAALYALKPFGYSVRVDAIYARTKLIYDSMARRLGSGYYDYLMAEGFAAFHDCCGGADVSAVFSVMDNYPGSGSNFVSVYGQSLPPMSTLSEPFIHVILEADFLVHAPSLRFLDFANRVYLAQSGRFSATGKLTAWSEGSSSYDYIYEDIVYPPQTWVIIQASSGLPLDPSTHPLIPLAYTKVAFAYLAIYGETPYTLALVNAAKTRADPMQGFSDATLEDGTVNGYNPNTTDKTNEFVLAAASRALSPLDFTISSNPQTFGVPLGYSATSTITVASMNGFSSAVTLSGSWVGSTPTGVTYIFSPEQVTPPSGGPGSSTLTFAVSSTASSGSFQLRVTGISGSRSHTCDISITISTLTSSTATSSQATETSTSSQSTQTGTTTTVTFTTTVETTVTTQGSELRLQVLSNSTITNLVYDPKRQLLNFTVISPENTRGLTSLTIAKGLLDGAPVVFVDGAAVDANLSEDPTYYYVRFSYPQSSHDVTVGGSNTIAEMPSAVVAMVSILVMATLMRRASVRKSKSKIKL